SKRGRKPKAVKEAELAAAAAAAAHQARLNGLRPPTVPDIKDIKTFPTETLHNTSLNDMKIIHSPTIKPQEVTTTTPIISHPQETTPIGPTLRLPDHSVPKITFPSTIPFKLDMPKELLALRGAVKTEPIDVEIPVEEIQPEKKTESPAKAKSPNALNGIHRPPSPKLTNQDAMNAFLLNEMKKMRQEMDRTNDEMLALRIQNMKLNNNIESIKARLPTNEPLLLTEGKGMVAFDLRRHPAYVLTANDIFCQMMGYTLEEVLGKPWQKFIHPDYIERTMSILRSRDHRNPTVSFEQMWVTRQGHAFATTDSHSIFFSNGLPVSDIVFMTLSTKTKPENDPVKETVQRSIGAPREFLSIMGPKPPTPTPSPSTPPGALDMPTHDSKFNITDVNSSAADLQQYSP
ncbi:GGDEF domain-containing protein, partial [Planoprotostelium fungivorum]